VLSTSTTNYCLLITLGIELCVQRDGRLAQREVTLRVYKIHEMHNNQLISAATHLIFFPDIQKGMTFLDLLLRMVSTCPHLLLLLQKLITHSSTLYQVCKHWPEKFMMKASRPALMALWANTLSCSAAGLAGWLAWQRGFNSCCWHVKFMSGFLHAMRINSRAGTEGLPVSSIKSDRPSHSDWRHLGFDESHLRG